MSERTIYTFSPIIHTFTIVRFSHSEADSSHARTLFISLFIHNSNSTDIFDAYLVTVGTRIRNTNSQSSLLPSLAPPPRPPEGRLHSSEGRRARERERRQDGRLHRQRRHGAVEHGRRGGERLSEGFSIMSTSRSKD